MSIIHFSIAFKALDTYVAQYNATSDSLSSRLRQPVIATARKIIRIYGASLLKVSKSSSFDASNIPSLKTNNGQLATVTHTSTRTIQRHLNKLLQANVITQKLGMVLMRVMNTKRSLVTLLTISVLCFIGY